MNIFTGTCGWSYREWVGPFYPQGVRPSLNYYSMFFNAIEVDSTYYAIPTKDAFNSMMKKMQDRLRISVKIPSAISHNHGEGRDADSEEFMENVVKPLRMKQREAPLLFTVPPWVSMDQLDSYTEELFSQLDGLEFIFGEIRHLSVKEIQKASAIFEKNRINLCFTDNVMNELNIFSLNQKDAYIRLHGRNVNFGKPGTGMEKFLYRYDNQTLDYFVKTIEENTQSFRNVFVFFNNHPQGNAAQNGMYVSKALGTSRQGSL